MSTLTWIPRKFKLLFNWNFPATLTLINFLQVESLHGWKCRRSNFISAVIAFAAWIHFIIARSFPRKSFHLFVTHSQPANARETVGDLAVSGFFFSLGRDPIWNFHQIQCFGFAFAFESTRNLLNGYGLSKHMKLPPGRVALWWWNSCKLRLPVREISH